MTTRRSFLKMLSAAAVVILVPYSWVRAKAAKVAFRLEKVPKLNTVDGWAVLKIKGRQILFIRDSETSVRALDSVCTHKKCTVAFNPETHKIECPCHGSKFSLDGEVLSGPAKKPLQSYPAGLSKDRIIVKLED